MGVVCVQLLHTAFKEENTIINNGEMMVRQCLFYPPAAIRFTYENCSGGYSCKAVFNIRKHTTLGLILCHDNAFTQTHEAIISIKYSSVVTSCYGSELKYYCYG